MQPQVGRVWSVGVQGVLEISSYGLDDCKKNIQLSIQWSDPPSNFSCSMTLLTPSLMAPRICKCESVRDQQLPYTCQILGIRQISRLRYEHGDGLHVAEGGLVTFLEITYFDLK